MCCMKVCRPPWERILRTLGRPPTSATRQFILPQPATVPGGEPMEGSYCAMDTLERNQGIMQQPPPVNAERPACPCASAPGIDREIRP